MRTTTLLAAALMLTPATLTAQDSEMIVTRADEREGRVTSSSENFTGTRYSEFLFGNREPFVVNGAMVMFFPNARTNWHSHPAGQVLIMTEGTGWVQQRGGERVEVRAGDVVWTPPGVEHWHGATDTTALSHYAIQQFEDGENVIWLEPVSDEEYLGD